MISDFHSVDDEEEGPESFVHSKQEYIDHVHQTIEYELIFNEI